MYHSLRVRGGGDIFALHHLTVTIGGGVWWALLLVSAALAVVIRVVRTPLERRWGGASPCRFRRRFLAALALLSVVWLCVYKGLLWAVTDYPFYFWNELPLQPCNVVALLSIPAALLQGRAARPLRAFCFYGGIVFSLAAMALPVDGFHDIPLLSVNAIGFYGFHGLVLATAISFASWELYRPSYWDTPAVLLLLTLLGGVVHLINLLLRATVYPQASYFYTCGLEGNPVLEGLLEIIPVYFLFELPLLLLMTLFCGCITLLFQLGRRLLPARALAL